MICTLMIVGSVSAQAMLTEPMNLSIPLVTTYPGVSTKDTQVERYDTVRDRPNVNFRYVQEYGRRGGFAGVYGPPVNYNYID